MANPRTSSLAAGAERITFELATLTFKCIGGRAPDYLVSMYTGVESVDARAHLRFATADRPLLPTTDTVTVGVRGFY